MIVKTFLTTEAICSFLDKNKDLEVQSMLVETKGTIHNKTQSRTTYSNQYVVVFRKKKQ